MLNELPANEKKKYTDSNCCETKLNFTKMKKLSRNEMKNVMGGNNQETRLTCTCSGPFGQSNSFQYANGTPEQWVISADIQTHCGQGGSATCIYQLPW